MRQIKFRGKRKDTGNWIIGDLFTSNGTECEISDWNTVDYSRYDVKVDTVGQYTGVFDMNNVEIVEGDIILFQKHANLDDTVLKRHIAIVIFHHGSFCWNIIKKGDDSQYNCANKIEPISNTCIIWGLEVIGNIYDNPELIN